LLNSYARQKRSLGERVALETRRLGFQQQKRNEKSENGSRWGKLNKDFYGPRLNYTKRGWQSKKDALMRKLKDVLTLEDPRLNRLHSALKVL
jgi:hypothetical protein